MIFERVEIAGVLYRRRRAAGWDSRRGEAHAALDYRLARLADLRRAAALEPYGLQIGDVDVLAPLWRHGGGLRPLDLRRSMMVGSGTLTARLKLEASRLLERRPDPDDRRGRLLYLTDEGDRLLPAVVSELLDIENDLLAAVPDRTCDRLAADLARVLADAEARLDEP